MFQDPLEFLAEVLQHIPPDHFHMARFFGYYSNVARGKRNRETATNEVPVEVPAPTQRVPRAVRKAWARLIAKIYEADPMLCPHCGATMKIIKFVQNEEEIRTTLMMLGIPYHNSSQPPPTHPPAADYIIVPEQDDPFAEDSDTIYLD